MCLVFSGINNYSDFFLKNHHYVISIQFIFDYFVLESEHCQNMKTNILFTLLAILTFCSCGEEDPLYTVPRSAVYFVLNTSVQDKELSGGGGTKTFTTGRLATDRMGFGGLLVVNSGMLSDGGLPILYAYDLACPKEDKRNITVKPDKSGVSATCPSCKSEFSIILGTGHVMSGPSTEPLQRYRISATNAYGEYRVIN